MSRFTIDLLENKKGNVWRLEMINVRHVDQVSIKPKSAKVISSSDPTYTFKAFKYEITISNDESNALQFLYKFANGEWFADHEGKIQIDGEELLAIKNAIIDKEKELNNT